MDISENELLAALEAAETVERPEGALTVAELVERMGWSEGRVRGKIKRELKAGVVGLARVQMVTMSGVTTTVPAYYLVKP